jgi:hypothetical protein
MIYSPKVNKSELGVTLARSNSSPFSSTMSVSLTPPTGQRVKLTGLSTNGVVNTGLTISIAGSVVVSDSFSNGSDSTFTIGSNTAYTGTLPPYKQIESLEGGIDEVVWIQAPTLNTSAYYSYEYGD